MLAITFLPGGMTVLSVINTTLVKEEFGVAPIVKVCVFLREYEFIIPGIP